MVAGAALQFTSLELLWKGSKITWKHTWKPIVSKSIALFARPKESIQCKADIRLVDRTAPKTCPSWYAWGQNLLKTLPHNVGRQNGGPNRYECANQLISSSLAATTTNQTCWLTDTFAAYRGGVWKSDVQLRGDSPPAVSICNLRRSICGVAKRLSGNMLSKRACEVRWPTVCRSKWWLKIFKEAAPLYRQMSYQYRRIARSRKNHPMEGLQIQKFHHIRWNPNALPPFTTQILDVATWTLSILKGRHFYLGERPTKSWSTINDDDVTIDFKKHLIIRLTNFKWCSWIVEVQFLNRSYVLVTPFWCDHTRWTTIFCAVHWIYASDRVTKHRSIIIWLWENLLLMDRCMASRLIGNPCL